MPARQPPLHSLLEKHFYAHVPFPIGKEAIQSAVEAFFAFLALPLHIKTHIDFTIALQHRRGDVGFKRREVSVDRDSKDFFHFHPAIFERYADFLEQHPAVENFARCALPIWEMAASTVRQQLIELESLYPGLSAKVFNTPHPHILLRFLRYEWQTAGKYLAKPHFDAGSFTLAIAESCQGLRIGSSPADLKLVQPQEGSAIFMLSSNFQKLISSETLLAGWHDVIQLDESCLGKPFARWAIVAFIEGAEVEALPRTATHKWGAAAVTFS